MKWNFSSLVFHGKFRDSLYSFILKSYIIFAVFLWLREKQVYFGMLGWPPDDLRQEHPSFSWSRGKRRPALFPPFSPLLLQPAERGIFLLNAVPEWICVISFNYTATRALKFTSRNNDENVLFTNPSKWMIP